MSSALTFEELENALRPICPELADEVQKRLTSLRNASVLLMTASPMRDQLACSDVRLWFGYTEASSEPLCSSSAYEVDERRWRIVFRQMIGRSREVPDDVARRREQIEEVLARLEPADRIWFY